MVINYYRKMAKRSKELKALIEAGREALRLVVIAAVPLVADGLNKGAVDWRGVLVVSAIVLLRFVEKYAYENGKAGTLNPISKVLTFSK
jgi:hypothetical protein